MISVFGLFSEISIGMFRNINAVLSQQISFESKIKKKFLDKTFMKVRVIIKKVT